MLRLLLAAHLALGGVPMTEELAPYTRPTVREPFPDGVSLAVPEGLGNRRLAELGLVDVTAAPFHADPSGRADATAAIQRAIVAARDAQMVCFFPPGTYRISDTLHCVQDLYQRSNRMVTGGRLHPCLLVGSRRGPRPRLLLAPRSPGFGDPEKPRYVVHFWARSLDGPTKPQPNISMNQMLVNLDIVVGEGNPGAVGIRHRAAQGSGVQDCTIDATHGLAGLEGGAGSGGSHANVTVLGGRVGLDLGETQPAPTVCGVTLVGQSEAAILYSGRQALCAVGLRIVSEAEGPLVRATAPRWAPHNGQVCLVDCRVECRRPGATVLTTRRSVYLRDVYVKGAAIVVADRRGPVLPADPDGWLRVREYAHGTDPPEWKRLQYRAPVYIDGVRRSADVVSVAAGEAPPDDLVSRHLWPRGFPHVEAEDAVSVKAPPYKARGDGQADDTEAIQRAIAEHPTVVLPKGYYRLSRTLRLRPATRLVGVGQHLSILFVREPEGDFADPSAPQPLVRTADDRAAATVLAFCGLLAPYHVPGAYALEWRAGRRSIVRSVAFMRRPLYGFRRPPAHATPGELDAPFVAVRGNGGGRWYNFYGESYRHATRRFRHLAIEGTREPLAVYQCNAEHARADANLEMRAARGVALYGLKGEGNYPIVWARGCDQVRIFGYGGNAAAYEGTALFRIERTENFLVANAVDSPRLAGQGSDEHFAGRGVDPTRWHMIQELSPAGEMIPTRPMDRPVLYRRGQPDSP
ncbi:MAG: glycosyl hydrolase family 28-related protein [Candidatus Brocadiia bacterium]